MKFKVGDKVKVKTNSRFDGGRCAGKEGTVERTYKGTKWPYSVRLNGGPHHIPFSAYEIEAAS